MLASQEQDLFNHLEIGGSVLAAGDLKQQKAVMMLAHAASSKNHSFILHHVHAMIEFLKMVRKGSANLITTAVEKSLCHMNYELLRVNQKKDSNGMDSVFVHPDVGGKKRMWIHVPNGGGESKRGVRWAASLAKHLVKLVIGKEVGSRKDKVVKLLYSAIDPPLLLARFDGYQNLVIPNACNQLLLQQAGGMTDRQMVQFNCLLVKLTGISIHSTKSTTATLTDGMMPGFMVYQAKMIVNSSI